MWKYVVGINTECEGIVIVYTPAKNSKYSSTELKFLFLYLFPSNFQDFFTPIEHTSVLKIINLGIGILNEGPFMCHFFPTALKGFGVLFSPMASGWAGVRAAAANILSGLDVSNYKG